jgi:hypothetical protein
LHLLEVAHHATKAGSEDVTATFKRFLTLLATFRGFKPSKQLLKLVDIKIVVSSTLTSRSGSHVLAEETLFNNYNNLILSPET